MPRIPDALRDRCGCVVRMAREVYRTMFFFVVNCALLIVNRLKAAGCMRAVY